MFRPTATLVAFSLCTAMAAAAQPLSGRPDPVWPVLTAYDLDSTVNLIEWLIDARLTPAQRQLVRSDVVDGWRRKDPGTLTEVSQLAQLHEQLIRLPAAKAEYVRRQVEQEIVGAIHGQIDPVATMLAAVYDASHPVIARGAPPLRRQQADAALDLFYFMAAQLEGVTAAPGPVQKAVWASALARSWPTLPVETRMGITAMPAAWALTVAAWPEMPPAMHEQVKAAYAQSDVVQRLRVDFVTARNRLRDPVAAPWTPQSPWPSAPAPAPNRDAVDISAQIATMNRHYQATSSMLTSGYNSTINLMAAFGNMSGTRYGVK